MIHAFALTIDIPRYGAISALLSKPACPAAGFAFAHGAGAGMTHPFMEAVAEGFAARGIATLRYQFPYMERGSRRPDPPAVAQATVRAAVDAAATAVPGLPLFAGGRSFGARMTSQAQASEPLPGVRGLCFFGFPLHPAGRPGSERGTHLSDVRVPMLFLQGTRDALAEVSLIEPLVDALGSRAMLYLVQDADHSFHVPARRRGPTDVQLFDEILDVAAGWMKDSATGHPRRHAAERANRVG